jgi:hypothetical protein
MRDLGGSFRYGFDDVHRSMVVQDAVAVGDLLDKEGSGDARELANRISTHLAEHLEDEFEFSHDDLRVLLRALRDEDLVPGSALYMLRSMLALHFDDAVE